ncbi:MAG: HAMP domain-containing sensor histidine kinase, partial [Balneolaceae bacterium]
MDQRDNGQPIKSNQENQLLNISRIADENITLKKKILKLTSELDQLKKRMKNLNHDIRSPLGGITGLMDLMIMDGDETVEVKTRDLVMIRESSQSLLDLINGTLLAGNVRNSDMENEHTDRELSSAMMEINRLYHPMAQTKELSLSLRTYINTEIQLSPDFHINLIQIIGNLVSNAIKFTPYEGTVDVVFTLDDEEGQTMLSITVADSGKSMSPDQVSAFNQGKQVSRSEGTNGEMSFGIGLLHVKKM